MKKVLFLSMIALMAFTSCATDNSKKQTNNNITEKTTQTMKPIELNKQEFLAKVVNYEANPNEWKYLGDKPAIIDFYASWCGPCKMVAPILEELAVEYGDKIYIYKVNTENEQELAAAFGIRSIPTILFVPLNEQPQVVTGAMPKSSFKQAIDNILLK